MTCSTDATTCVSGQDVVVGAVTEAYEGTACAGLVTDIAVPPGPSVDSTIAPLQPPSVVQALVEARVQALQAQIPTWASATCQRAARARPSARGTWPARQRPPGHFWYVPASSSLLPSHRRRRRDSADHSRRPSTRESDAIATRRRGLRVDVAAARERRSTPSTTLRDTGRETCDDYRLESLRACCPGPTPT